MSEADTCRSGGSELTVTEQAKLRWLRVCTARDMLAAIQSSGLATLGAVGRTVAASDSATCQPPNSNMYRSPVLRLQK